MRKLLLLLGVLGITALPSGLTSPALWAGDLGWLDFGCLLKRTPLDEHCPSSCNQCGHEGCIERCPVDECVTGEKKVYKPSVHCQYVAIPETRYRWEVKCVEKEVPACYCKPVCKSEEYDHCYQSEHWEKQCDGCAEIHCKTCQPNTEKLECKHCETEEGKTMVKVHYLSYVKVPYTVYRQVPKEVCVKQPRCEKTDVPITRYVPGKSTITCCPFCKGKGCLHCRGQGSEDPGASPCTVSAEQNAAAEQNVAPEQNAVAEPMVERLPPAFVP